ncbi:sensor histidine kinase [Gudongella sp. SC589]|jgi:two-component system sensor histidine kinase KdpD|uniref:sensor histidine kinase n=1 Tax=Gudongella sp. SC589 TaxID=3385990 RepID=UPI003904861B
MVLPGRARHYSSWMKTTIIIGIAVIGSLGISYLGVAKESIIMLFLLGVIFSTIVTSSSMWGIIASVISMMVMNFLFTEPRFTFVIYDSGDLILLLFFLITAVVSGTITSRLQQQIELAEKNERTTQVLYRIASGFIAISGESDIINRARYFVQSYTGLESEVIIYDEMNYQENAIGVNKDFPIKGSEGILGKIRIAGHDSIEDSQTEIIIQSIATQLGIALEGERLYLEREQIKVAMEKERLRANLLRSVSHDLRTPLTALSGAGNLLAENFEQLDDKEKKQLATDISEEIGWLTNLVENILNMTRINNDQLILKKEDEVVDDVISEAVSRTKTILRDRDFQVALPTDVISVPMDGKLIVQVIVNLLENAVRHTPKESSIALEVELDDGYVEFIVSDTGEGVDRSIKNSIFDRFVTLDKGITDGKRGIGLGLSICKAIVEAHGGKIYTEENKPTGSRFIFTLPAKEEER